MALLLTSARECGTITVLFLLEERMAEFNESKHPRDEDGKFTDGNKTYYRQSASYGEIVAADKKA